ncbi:TIGR02677 family protein [Pseudonocardia sp.]|uniref:TIGR02677 family protein n=1 Tax=Pseudonocardia sp. TaxID=60912 RepID=UPI003D11C528
MSDPVAFGIDAFTLDDRMRLFHFLAAEKRTSYLWLLRAFDRARANYQVLLHTPDVAVHLEELAAEHPDCALPDDLAAALDALVAWGNLDRGQDAARAATVQEYRNRHSVYQLTDAGYRAYRAVEQVLAARLDDATLSRLVFPDILADLRALVTAAAMGDAEEVYRKLTRLDRALTDMAERAARFYLLLGELGRSTDHRAEVFLHHKDALLAHMREFHSELLRYSPRLRAATHAVAATGVERLLEMAAEADDRLFRTPAERLADWQHRWAGLVAWFGASQPPAEADRLQQATVAAIGDVLAMLRRVTEARRGGVSRESQLRHLAAWFAALPSDDTAHALYDATFALRTPRHLGIAHDDPEAIPTRRTWWEAPAVEVSRTLVETGKPGSPGRPAAVQRNEGARRRLREQQVADAGERRAAAAALATGGAHGRVLSEPETVVLLALLDRALGARAPLRAAVRAAGSAYGVRLELSPCTGTSTVRTVRGLLHLDGVQLAVRPLAGPGPRPLARDVVGSEPVGVGS